MYINTFVPLPIPFTKHYHQQKPRSIVGDVKPWRCHSNTTKQQQTQQQQHCLQRTKTTTDHCGDADSGFQNNLRTDLNRT